MKNILITGGPTNEYIDEVMKITNMSTGSLSTNLGMRFLEAGYSVTLVLNRSVNTEKLLNMEQSSNLEIIPVETTADMLEAIEACSKDTHYDALIHAAAVGDFTSEFSFLLECFQYLLDNL